MNDYTGGSVASTRSRNWVRHGAVTGALLAFVFMGLGCRSLSIRSTPPGAHVLMNGVDTGLTTPASIRVRHLPLGETTITVARSILGAFNFRDKAPTYRLFTEGWFTVKEPETWARDEVL